MFARGIDNDPGLDWAMAENGDWRLPRQLPSKASRIFYCAGPLTFSGSSESLLLQRLTDGSETAEHWSQWTRRGNNWKSNR